MIQLTPPVNFKDHVLGEQYAPIELVEYGDYECPYCGRAHPIVKEIQRELGASIRFVFRNFPLRKIHPNAFSAAVATEAAGLQQKFWEMHDIVFENQKTLDPESIFRLAHMIDLDPGRHRMDMQQKALIEKVEDDFYSGMLSGVNRTPTFFINGEKFSGDWEKGELHHYLANLAISIIIS